MGYTVEKIMRVYDDSDGSFIEVANDPDLESIFMIRLVNSEGKEESRIAAIEADQLRGIQQAISEMLNQ